jgi:branched-chain amino acid aminotransferase
MFVYLNGKFVPEKKALVPVSDHGFLYGDGIYETLIAHDGRVFHMRDHLARLKASANGLSLRIPASLPRLASSVTALLRKNRLMAGQAVIRITVTRGPGPHGFDPAVCKRPTLVITAKSFGGYPAIYYKTGVRAAVVSIQRNSAKSLPPSIKSISCLNGVLAKMESLRLGAQEGIMLSEDGSVAEGTVSNVFMVKGDLIATPVLDGALLAGVTRAAVLKIAKRAGYKTREKKILPAELFSADEIFLTNTLMGVLPVREIFWKGKTRFKTLRFPAAMHVGAMYKALCASSAG